MRTDRRRPDAAASMSFARPTLQVFDPRRLVPALQPIPDVTAFALALLQLQNIASEPVEITIRAASGERVIVDLTATVASLPAPGSASARREEAEPIPEVVLELFRQGYTREQVRVAFRIAATNRRRMELLERAEKAVAAEQKAQK